jgi:hypothetical protein
MPQSKAAIKGAAPTIQPSIIILFIMELFPQGVHIILQLGMLLTEIKFSSVGLLFLIIILKLEGIQLITGSMFKCYLLINR